MQNKGRPKSFDRDKVLEIGLRLFWSQGYDNVSTDQICKACGLSKPSLYNSFGNKEMFFVECFKTYNQIYVSALAVHLVNESDPIVGSEKLLKAAAEQFLDPTFPTGCLAVTGLVEVKGKSPLIDEQLKISQEALMGAFEGYFAARIPPGHKTSAKDLGQFLAGQLFALAVFSRSNPELFDFDSYVTMSANSLRDLLTPT